MNENEHERKEIWIRTHRAIRHEPVSVDSPAWEWFVNSEAVVWRAQQEAMRPIQERTQAFLRQHPGPAMSLMWPQENWVQYIHLLIEAHVAGYESAPTRETIVQEIVHAAQGVLTHAIEQAITRCIQEEDIVSAASWEGERLSVPPPAPVPLKPSERFAILKRDDYQCRLCGRRARTGSTVALEVDHITPRVKGGTNDPSNLWTLCAECNRGKGINEL